MKVAGELLGNLHDAYVAGDRAYRGRGLLLRIVAMLTAMVLKISGSGSGSGHLGALGSGSVPL